jgi:hypothetical protein
LDAALVVALAGLEEAHPLLAEHLEVFGELSRPTPRRAAAGLAPFFPAACAAGAEGPTGPRFPNTNLRI